MSNILFVCIGNTCRSQMAEGFATRYANDRVMVQSAGTNAMGHVSRSTIEIMDEIGIDIRKQTSKQLTSDMLDWADVVVTLGCCSANELCPVTFKGKKIDWDIKDPIGAPPDFFRMVRDDIERRVKELIDDESR